MTSDPEVVSIDLGRGEAMVTGGERSDDATPGVDSETRDDQGGYMVGSAESSELARALQEIDYPLIVHDATGTIQLANQAAADVAGVALEDVVGTPVAQFVSPVDLVKGDVADLATGRFEGFTAARSVTPRGGDPIPVCAFAYAIEVDGQRLGVGVSVPQSELGRLGRHPLRRSMELVPIAVGLAREDWTIVSISKEVKELIDRRPAECIGLRLMDIIHPDDAAELKDQFSRTPAAPFVLQGVRFTTDSGQWNRVSVLVAPVELDSARIRFALAGPINPGIARMVGDGQDLDLRLRRMGADLHAAGVIDSIAAVPALEDHARMGRLTSRQWEILTRLLRGERVATIAKALFISPSTVRNHLSAIFEKFGVHSQAELIELIRSEDR